MIIKSKTPPSKLRFQSFLFLNSYQTITYPTMSSLKHGSYSKNSQNTLVPYSVYNVPVQTKSDDSFVTILTNSELYCTTPHTPIYKYTQVPSPSPHTQHPQPRLTPHPLSYSALPTTRIVSLRLQSTLLVSTSAPPLVVSQHHMTHILLKTLPIHVSLF